MYHTIIKNNPKQREIIIVKDESKYSLWKINILPEWGICFFPSWKIISENKTFFLGNNKIEPEPRPSNEDHITFHANGRVHLSKNRKRKDIIFNRGINEKGGMSNQRDAINYHKPQLLRKMKITLNSLPIYQKRTNHEDIVLHTTEKNKVFLTCWIFSLKDLLKALNTKEDPYSLSQIPPVAKNVKRIPFWEVTNGENVKYHDIIALLTIWPYEENPSLNLKNYSNIFSVEEYSEEWGIPYIQNVN